MVSAVAIATATKHTPVQVPRMRTYGAEILITRLSTANTWWEFTVTMTIIMGKYLFSFVFDFGMTRESVTN